MPAPGGLDPERDREVRLAGADRPGDHDVLGALQVLAARQLRELRPLDALQRLPRGSLERGLIVPLSEFWGALKGPHASRAPRERTVDPGRQR